MLVCVCVIEFRSLHILYKAPSHGLYMLGVMLQLSDVCRTSDAKNTFASPSAPGVCVCVRAASRVRFALFSSPSLIYYLVVRLCLGGSTQ